jgi:mRNA-degrading endonuclease toxin of MazEF toxin-antitoxin module
MIVCVALMTSRRQAPIDLRDQPHRIKGLVRCRMIQEAKVHARFSRIHHVSKAGVHGNQGLLDKRPASVIDTAPMITGAAGCNT